MTDTLPIVFAVGQNEGTDPRVLPAEQQRSMSNVRFRKDGRPQKRPGLAQITSTGLDSGGSLYTTQAVNAIAEWNSAPVLALGGGVRQYGNGAWTSAANAQAGELSHWGPGEIQPVARVESSDLGNTSCGAANGVVLYVWDNGTNVYASVRTTGGATLIASQLIQAGAKLARVVTCSVYLYVLTYSGGTLSGIAFDPSTLTFTAFGVLRAGLLSASYDAVGRSGEFIVATQTGAATITVERFSGSSTAPASLATKAVAMGGAATAQIAVACTTTSNVFLAWRENAGRINYSALSSTLGTSSAVTTVDLSPNNTDCPAVLMRSNTTAVVFFGGEVLATLQDFMSARPVDNVGGVGASTSYLFVRMASKPFNGPAQGTVGDQDRGYVWVHSNDGGGFDDQRTFHLLQCYPYQPATPRRQLWTPGVYGTEGGLTPSRYPEAVDMGGSAGFVTVFKNAIRLPAPGSTIVETYGIDSVSFCSMFQSGQLLAARDTAVCGRALQFAGGTLAEYNGACEETALIGAPVITNITLAVGSSLSASSTYIYRAVFEYIDKQGRRHRSQVSDPYIVTTPAAVQTATLTIWGLVAHTKSTEPVVHVYRTLANQSTYHRITKGTNAPAAWGSIITVIDNVMTDAALAPREFLYTDGGVLDNTPAPPCTFMTVCNSRLWLGGQLARNVITASKILVDGEPTQFSDFEAFSVFLPDKCTGIGSIDGTVVAFARNRIFLVNGEGPDDQGSGSFNPPTELPSDVGCIDWRSVVETSIGVFFQSKRGIFLLPRGFGTPIFIGAPVQDTLALFPTITSATVVAPADGNELTVRFTVTDIAHTGAVLVYDLRAGGWSVDTSPASSTLGMGGTWLDAWVQVKVLTSSENFSSLWQETPAAWADEDLFIPTSIRTGDVRPFGIAGFGVFKSVMVLGEYRASSVVTVTVSVDGVSSDSFSFPVTSADSNDGVVYLDVTPKIFKGSSISVSVSDATNPATGSLATEGFIPQAVFIEHEMISKTKPLAAARRA